MRVSVAVTIFSWESLATCMIPLVMFGYMFGLPRPWRNKAGRIGGESQYPFLP
jgi:hypothetical protein